MVVGSTWLSSSSWYGLTQTEERRTSGDEGPLTALLNSINGDTNAYVVTAAEDP